MTSKRDRIGSALRLSASGGFAEQDADLVMDLVRDARVLAATVVADEGASPPTRELAQRYLDEVRDAFLDR